MAILKGMEIKLARIHAGIKQQDFAELLGISKIHLNMVENCKRESYKVRVLATEYFENLKQESVK